MPRPRPLDRLAATRPLLLLGAVALFLVLAFAVLAGGGGSKPGAPAALEGAAPPAAGAAAGPVDAAPDRERREEQPPVAAAAAAPAPAEGEVLVLRAADASGAPVVGAWEGPDGASRPFRMDAGRWSARVRLPEGAWRLDAPGWLADPPRLAVVAGDSNRVVLTPSRGGAFRVLDGDFPMPGVAVRLVARKRKAAPDWRWEGVTASDGVFRVPDLPGGAAKGRFTAPDGRVMVARLEAPPTDEVADVRFAAERPPTELRVVEAGTGLPVAGARLALQGFPDEPLATSGPDGVAALPPRSKSADALLAEADGFAARTFWLDDLPATEGVPTLALTRTGAVELRLLTPAGEPVADARVALLVPDEDGRPTPGPWVVSDRDGRVRPELPLVPPEGCLLVALHDDGWWGRRPPPPPGTGAVAWQLEPPRPLSITFAGAPAPDDRPLVAWSETHGRRRVPAADGAFTLAAPFLWDTFRVPTPAGGTLQVVRSSGPGRRWNWFLVGPDAFAGRLVLPDAVGGEARVRLLGPDGRPLADWPLALERFDTDAMRENFHRWPELHGQAPTELAGWALAPNGLHASGVTDANGEVRLSGLPAGPYRLSVAEEGDPVPRRAVDAAPGEPLLGVPTPGLVEVRVPGTLELDLTVLDDRGRPVPRFHLQVADVPFASADFPLDLVQRDGRCRETIEFAPGTRLRILALGFEPHPLEVTPGGRWKERHRGTVRLRPLAPMRVTLADDAPGPVEATVYVRHSRAQAEYGILLDSYDVRLEPGAAAELDAVFDGCWVEVVAPQVDLEPEGFTWSSGGTQTLRARPRDG